MAINFYSQATVAGQMFIGTTAVGGVQLAIYNSTAPTFALWNPATNQKKAILVALDIGIVSGTPVVGNFTISQTANAGYAIAANNPVTAATLVAPVNALLGSTVNSTMNFAPATLTLNAAPTLVTTLGMSQGTTALAAGSQVFHYDFWDTLALAPGALITIGGNAAPGTVIDVSLRWYEQ